MKINKTKCREEIYRLIAEISNQGVWYLDIVGNQRFFLSDWYEQFGFAKDQPYPAECWDALIHEDDLPGVKQALQDHLEGKSPLFQCEYRVRTSGGHYRWVEARGQAFCDDMNRPCLIAGAHSDIEQYKGQQEMIHHMAYHDQLTDLPNRVLFMDRLNMVTRYSKRHQSKAAVIFLDLDNFKTVNEVNGHECGDRLLQMAAARLTRMTRSYETVARMGGDEFALVLQGLVSIEEAASFGERLKSVLNTTFELEGNQFDLGASIGIAIYPDDGLTPEELLYNADTAMCKVKTGMKNGWQFFKPDMKGEVERKIEIKKRLRRAFANQEFQLFYQPQIDMKTGKIRAVEALIRWYDPVLGWVSPMELIPIVEETGYIVQLGEWVLREACRQNRIWRDHCNVTLIVAVNISAVQLKEKKFVELVTGILEESQIKPECLELEITESVFIHSFEEVAAMLDKLRQLGVKISLDDFGTGYSSLSYLKRLPLDTLKIDKSFIDDIHGDDRGKNITEAIVDLVHKLGLITVAEGVETQKQLDCLMQSKCDMVQGFLLGKPLPAEEVFTLLQSNFSYPETGGSSTKAQE